MDENIKPSAIGAIESAFNTLLETGLTKQMIITLIQKETKLSRIKIKGVLDAIFKIEAELVRNRNK